MGGDCRDETHIAIRTGAKEGNEGTPIQEDRLFRPGVKSTGFYCGSDIGIAGLNHFLDIPILRMVVNATEGDFLYRVRLQ